MARPQGTERHKWLIQQMARRPMRGAEHRRAAEALAAAWPPDLAASSFTPSRAGARGRQPGNRPALDVLGRSSAVQGHQAGWPARPLLPGWPAAWAGGSLSDLRAGRPGLETMRDAERNPLC